MSNELFPSKVKANQYGLASLTGMLKNGLQKSVRVKNLSSVVIEVCNVWGTTGF